MILNEAYIGIAGTFLKTGNADSTLIYAEKGTGNVELEKIDTSKMKTSAKLMSGIFKFQNRTTVPINTLNMLTH